MIEKQYGKIMLVCDTCGEGSNDYMDDEFNEMILDAKHDGWLIIHDEPEGEWEHVCPNCAD